MILYFSTASILDRNNDLLLAASQFGTDYIRTKYQCFSALSRLKISDRIIALFPTLVFGGDSNKPFSHLSSGFSEVIKWLDLIRWIKTDGSFHFVHGQDIATVVTYLVNNSDAILKTTQYQNNNEKISSVKKVVLGNEAITANEAISQLCGYFGKKVYFGIPLYVWLTNILIKIFRIQMDSWSYFSLNYRHFTYKNPVTPANFGLDNYVANIDDLMKVSGF